jgi:ribokinase/sulfofructose kinase
MNKTIDLLAIGDPCADVVIRAERVPTWDDKCIGSPAGVFAGGTEANVACAASRLGLATTMFGQVGDDSHAAFLLDDFARFGVDSSWMARRSRTASATTVILVSPQGERALVWVPMPPGARASEQLDAALQRSRIAYTMPYDEAELAALGDAARRSGTQLAIDVEREGAARPGALQRLLQHCDIAFMNETGFSTAMGSAPSAEGLRALHAGGRAHTIVVTLGARGAIAIDAHGVAMQAAMQATVLDTTGAGDTFNAAFLTARCLELDLNQALAFGCAAASKTVAVIGARSGLPTLGEVQALLRSTPSPSPLPPTTTSPRN